MVNPFGTIFSPVSLFELTRLAVEQQTLPTNQYIAREGMWFHYAFHSQFWANTQTDLAYQLQVQTDLAYQTLKKAKFLFITLGTAWVYEARDLGVLVANCHKQPAHFLRKNCSKLQKS
ncbi:MAG: GSCFA domain-containing protein [Saprospiraceae bacterium]|nr:GSCFA domain-containing protein [Saprospiraceae bacterium]